MSAQHSHYSMEDAQEIVKQIRSIHRTLSSGRLVVMAENFRF